jgi:hypothetical protein
MTLTHAKFTQSIEHETEQACEEADDALVALIHDLQRARTALALARDGQVYFPGDLDIYGNRLAAVPKACTRAYTLLNLNGRAQRIEENPS